MLFDKTIDRAVERIVKDDPKSKELILLRVKLEMRTMFVRVLTAYSISVTVGAIIQIARAVGLF